MTLFDVNMDTMTPAKLVNPKALSAVVRDFFGRSQLSQFMDQLLTLWVRDLLIRLEHSGQQS
jgi:DNA-directed RNA polymerase beta subunit